MKTNMDRVRAVALATFRYVDRYGDCLFCSRTWYPGEQSPIHDDYCPLLDVTESTITGEASNDSSASRESFLLSKGWIYEGKDRWHHPGFDEDCTHTLAVAWENRDNTSDEHTAGVYSDGVVSPNGFSQGVVNAIEEAERLGSKEESKPSRFTREEVLEWSKSGEAYVPENGILADSPIRPIDTESDDSLFRYGVITDNIDRLRRALGLREGKHTADSIAGIAIIRLLSFMKGSQKS